MYKKSPLYTPGNAGKSDIVSNLNLKQDRGSLDTLSGRFGSMDHKIISS